MSVYSQDMIENFRCSKFNKLYQEFIQREMFESAAFLRMLRNEYDLFFNIDENKLKIRKQLIKPNNINK